MHHIIIQSMTQSAEQSAENRRRNIRDFGIIAAVLWGWVIVGGWALLSQMQHAADIASRV